MSELLGFFKELAGLILLVLTEYYQAKKKAREDQEKYELDRARFTTLVVKALAKIRKDATSESDQARRIEDEIDQELKKKRDESEKMK